MVGEFLEIVLDAVEWGVKALRRPPVIDTIRAIEGFESLQAPPPEPEPDPGPVTQWGLKVPNGNVVWDNALYCGNPLATPEQRVAVTEALKKTALELGFVPEDFLKGFGWVSRVGVPALAWSDASFVPLVEQEQQQGVNGTNGHVVGPVDANM